MTDSTFLLCACVRCSETNLKIRQALPETSHLTDPAALADLRGDIECEGPSRHLYSFSGSLHVEGSAPLSVGVKQLLLRVRSPRTVPHRTARKFIN